MNLSDILAQAIKKAGNQSAFAKQHNISTAYLSDVINGRKEAGDKILDALGLERVVTHRWKTAPKKNGKSP